MKSHDGLQPWSVGPIYPWMIRGLGRSLQAFNGVTGEAGRCYDYDFKVEGSFKTAHAAATADCRAADVGETVTSANAVEQNSQLNCVAA